MKNQLHKSSSNTEAERSERIRDAARELETDNDPASFERAFASVARGARKPRKPESKKEK